MPENETLIPDAKTASRWRPLRERLDRGEELIDLFPEIEREFYGCVQAIFRQWRGYGVDPAEFFAAATNDREALHSLVQKVRHHDYARLLVDVVAAERGADLDRVIRCWIDAAWESARAQTQVDRHEASRRGDFAGRVDRMLGRLSRQIAKDPSQSPRRPPRDKPLDIDDILGLDLPRP